MTPETCGGKPRVAGTRIRVSDVVGLMVTEKMSVEEVVREYPALTPADVHSAMAFYYDNRELVDAGIQRDESFGRD
jgi:uncharacterized protein (DUF433 family)